MTKREARALAKARRAELDMQAVGCGMARALFALPCWAAADTVLAFAAMPDEPDTAAILRQALADGKRLLLPRVRSRTEMDWVEIPSLSLLQPGAYGIGCSWGYSKLLSTRWNFIVEIGAGIIYTPYTEKLRPKYIGEFDDEYTYHHRRFLLVPIKCNLSFSYLF